jgi:lysophospholipase L1-like esterase
MNLVKGWIAILLSVVLIAWKPARPSVFLIGDSISIQYGPYLEKYLEGFIDLSRKQDDGQAAKNLDVPVGANGGDSRMVLEYLKIKLKEPDFHADYLLLNCGLHDIKHNMPDEKIQVSQDDYKNNLMEIIRLVSERKIQIIWIRTTPVVDTIHNKPKGMKRYAADVAAYNQIADEICLQKKIPMIDLFTFTRKLGNEQFIDHVHYNESARALQAAYIAGFLQNHILGKTTR